VSHDVITGLIFIIYIIAMIWIGAAAYGRTHNLSDYILGGRSLGRWVSALSAGASDMSGWLLLGLPGYAYLAGYEAIWIAIGLLLGTYLNWRIMAVRLRCYSELADDSLTLPDYLEKRFADPSHLLRLISAFFILLFFLFYTSSGLVAGGKLFTSVFDISYHGALLLGVISILIYTFIGGFLAVSWTDLIQGLLMVAVLVVVPLLAILSLGGWEPMQAAMQQQNPARLSLWSNQQGEPLGVMAIISLLGWGLGYFGQPHILARFAAVRSPAVAVQARRIATGWTALGLGGALLVGFSAAGYLPDVLPGSESEKVFIYMVQNMLPPTLAAICLAAILAAIMSTADSQLLVSASVLIQDFYQSLLRRDAGQHELVWAGRGAVVAITVIATCLAWEPGRKVLDLVAYAWAGFGAAFGPVLLFSLYWRRMTRWAAIGGLLSGGITVVWWKALQGGIFDLYEIVPGVLIASLVIVLITLASPPPPARVTTLYDRTMARLEAES
jgi:sodium/proline symporter